MNMLRINSLGGAVTDMAEIAVTPIAETIFESMIFETVVNSVSKKDGTPIFTISFIICLSVTSPLLTAVLLSALLPTLL
jgi:hypothetical protein